MQRRFLFLGLLLALTLAACQDLAKTPAPDQPPTQIIMTVTTEEAGTPTLLPTQTAASGMETPTPAPETPVPAATATPSHTPAPSPTSVPTATSVPQPTATATPALGRITGRVWEDRCEMNEQGQPGPTCWSYETLGYAGDGQHQEDEPLLAGVVVHLAQGPCPGQGQALTTTNAQGVFTFDGLKPGTYCVSIPTNDPTNSLIQNAVWTQPEPTTDAPSFTVTLEAGQTFEVNFAFTRLQPSATPTPTPAPTPTPTPQLATHPHQLGQPDFYDDMKVPGKYWYLWKNNYAEFTGEYDYLIMRIRKPSASSYWVRSVLPPLKDAYIEAAFVTGSQCFHKDRYGLVVRAPNRYEGVWFMVSCDGMFKIFQWNGGLKVLQEWEYAYPIHTGPRQVNRVGVWMEGDTLTLYINRSKVAEVKVSEPYTSEGLFGLAIGAEGEEPLEIKVDWFQYWVLPKEVQPAE